MRNTELDACILMKAEQVADAFGRCERSHLMVRDIGVRLPLVAISVELGRVEAICEQVSLLEALQPSVLDHVDSIAVGTKDPFTISIGGL